jgi:hypothetical protein
MTTYDLLIIAWGVLFGGLITAAIIYRKPKKNGSDTSIIKRNVSSETRTPVTH